jgi:signal peptidase I
MKLVQAVQAWFYCLLIALAAALFINIFVVQHMVVEGQALFINIFVVQHMVVEGHSMEPTLQNHEHLCISKLSHTLGQAPGYGDIVVVDSRVDRQRDMKDDLTAPINAWVSEQRFVLIKRVIGRPGDVLEFKDGFVYRNGIRLDEPYIKEPMKYATAPKTTVAANHIFVMGDNRNDSRDSRYIGNIPLDHVLGVMWFRLWPW